MRISPSAGIALIAIALLSGCERTQPSQAQATAPAPADSPISAADMAGVTATYRCENGNTARIVRDQVVRLTLHDGSVVKLEWVKDSAPRTYMDNGLTFVVERERATLSDESNQEVNCRLHQPEPRTA